MDTGAKYKLLDAAHNGIVHPICALLWLGGDVLVALGHKIIAVGTRVHNVGWSENNPLTHAQAAHLARYDARDPSPR